MNFNRADCLLQKYSGRDQAGSIINHRGRNIGQIIHLWDVRGTKVAGRGTGLTPMSLFLYHPPHFPAQLTLRGSGKSGMCQCGGDGASCSLAEMQQRVRLLIP